MHVQLMLFSTLASRSLLPTITHPPLFWMQSPYWFSFTLKMITSARCSKWEKAANKAPGHKVSSDAMRVCGHNRPSSCPETLSVVCLPDTLSVVCLPDTWVLSVFLTHWVSFKQTAPCVWCVHKHYHQEPLRRSNWDSSEDDGKSFHMNHIFQGTIQHLLAPNILKRPGVSFPKIQFSQFLSPIS